MLVSLLITSHLLFIKDANLLRQDDLFKALKEARNQGAYIQWNHPGYRQAIYLLGATGSGAEKVAPFLVSALQSPDRVTRRYAASSLVGIGPAARAAVPELITALQDNAIQTWAIKALGNVGADARAAIPDLKPMLAKTNLEAAIALHKIDSGETEAFALLMSLLTSKDNPDRRKDAVWALMNLGPLAVQAVPDLIELIRDPDFDTWNGAVNALHQISPRNPDVIPPLLTKLKGGDLDQIMAAIQLLRIDPSEPHGVSAMITLLETGTNMDRVPIMDSLAKAGTNAALAVPTLKKFQGSSDKRERAAAARALRLIEVQPAPVRE